MLANHFLFVYGTLRKGFDNPYRALLNRKASFLCAASMCGRLYDLGPYPGALLSIKPKERVIGELYWFSGDSLLAKLDEYEGCFDNAPGPWEFVRQQVDVRALRGAKELTAWTYLYNAKDFSVSYRKRIRSGDYLSR